MERKKLKKHVKIWHKAIDELVDDSSAYSDQEYDYLISTYFSFMDGYYRIMPDKNK